jgi:hypothetical protein
MNAQPLGVVGAALGLSARQIDTALRTVLAPAVIRNRIVNGKPLPGAGLLQIDTDHPSYASFAALPPAERKQALGLPVDPHAR